MTPTLISVPWLRRVVGLLGVLLAPVLVIIAGERESISAPAAAATGNLVDLDCTGLACPGPIMKMSSKMADLNFGDEIRVKVSDPGFALDAPAWAKNNGHTMVSIEPAGAGYQAVIRKGGAGQLASQASVALDASGPQKVSFVVFSGDLDKLIAAFIIANGALAMGKQVSMFFTFWGLNALRKNNLMTFDSILIFGLDVCRHLKLNNGLPYSCFLIDETQDSSPMDFKIYGQLLGERFLAADTDQAIYGFRGGDVSH